MSLVSAKEMAYVLHLERLGILGQLAGSFFLHLLRLNHINKIYEDVKHLKGRAFFDELLNKLNIKIEIPEDELLNLPEFGSFITISNHPLGGEEGIILLKILTDVRSDFKITANFLLSKVDPLAPYLIPVNPFHNRKVINRKTSGAFQALEHLQNGHALGFFPAGEVSTKKSGKIYVDKPWDNGVMHIIQKSQVPVIPIYFHAKNSRFFYLLAKVNSTLRTAKLPSELLYKRKSAIKVRIGTPIKPEEYNKFESTKELKKYLRNKTYILSNVYTIKFNPLNTAKRKLKRFERKPSSIVEPTDQKLLEKEVNYLLESDKRLLAVKNYEIFFTKIGETPSILHELGRLREHTFRSVGEGTNKKTDIDNFDHYYYHLFLWDKSAKIIVGAYRLGFGEEIYTKYGINGFYISSLFKFDSKMNGFLSESIEMGRAFIIESYQRKPMPLFLLWKGIIYVTLRNPQCKYLIGGVSISNQFSEFSKSLMIEFMKSHFFDNEMAKYIKPRKDYKVKLKDADKEFVFNQVSDDMNKFDRFISEIEPKDLRIPILIKKYIKQNAKIVAFNVDPKFNNAIDGLMYIKISDLPESTIKPVIEEYQQELLKKEN